MRRFKIGMLRLGPVVTLAVFLCAMATSQARGEQRRSDMLVTTEWLAGHLQDRELIVLCVAEDEPFYSSGHIPGSRLLRLSDIVTTRDGVPNQLPVADLLQKALQADGVNNDSRIVLYGERSGVLAARAYFTLDYLGLADRAALLDGGIEKWRAEGRQQSTDTPRVVPTSLRIRLQPEIVVKTPQVAEYSHAGPNNIVLLDARPPVEYSGEKLSENVSRAGHIPLARNLYWKDLLREGDIPELRSEQELRTRFEDAGATSAKEVITYCRTGMQSSFDYFVLKYLGYPARMYVGSFYEWTRAPRSTEVKAFCH